MPHRLSDARALICMLAATICLAPAGCVDATSSVSDPDKNAPAHFWVQSETSLARAATPANEPLSNSVPTLVAAYNDFTEMLDPATRDWNTNYSLTGVSVSLDAGDTWERLGQLPLNPAQGVEAIRGDPWIAAVGTTVVYVALTGPTASPGEQLPSNPTGVMMAVSVDGGQTWPQSRVRQIYATPNSLSDGPKVSLSRDGSLALVTWKERIGSFDHTFYTTVHNPSAISPTIDTARDLDVVSPPDRPVCQGSDTTSSIDKHPVGAIGPSGAFYIARVVSYLNLLPTPDPNEPDCFTPGNPFYVELLRSTDQGNSWLRIHSRRIVQERDGRMLGINLNTRPGIRPSLVITPTQLPPQGYLGDVGEDALIALEARYTASNRFDPNSGLVTAQYIELFRVYNSNTCSSSGDMEEGCTFIKTLPHQEVELYEDTYGGAGHTQGVNYYPVENPYHWAFQPALWTGGNNTAGPDRRVGLHFYVQPYRYGGLIDDHNGVTRLPTEEEQRLTIVVGLRSGDNGYTWEPGTVLTAKIEGRESVYEDTLSNSGGVVFTPCPLAVTGYFGDYNGGAFVDESSLTAVAAWADSREGCMAPPVSVDMPYQHAFSARFPFAP